MTTGYSTKQPVLLLLSVHSLDSTGIKSQAGSEEKMVACASLPPTWHI